MCKVNVVVVNIMVVNVDKRWLKAGMEIRRKVLRNRGIYVLLNECVNCE